MKECPECKKKRLEEQKAKEKATQTSSCCCGDNKEKHAKKSSCCCSEHKEESTKTSSCCSTAKEKKEESCSCGCGIDRSQKEPSGCGCEKSANPIKKDIVKLVICALLLVVSFVLTLDSLGVYANTYHWVALFSPAWIVIVWCGAPIFRGAYKNLKKGKITSALLISIAIVASIALEFFMTFAHTTSTGHDHYLFAAGEIALLMALGTIIEDYTVKKSRKGIEDLIALAPKTALIEKGGDVVEVDISTIKKGDIVVVMPDQMISVDGVVVSGTTAVDESCITGEYLPKDKSFGDLVYAGTKNTFGLITIYVNEDVENSVVMRLIKLTEESEKTKAPIARIADRWAGYIVPSAIILALVVFFVATFGLKAGYVEGLVRAVTVLVVFCPCSLALATPTAIAAGLGNASKKGVLIKSGQALEILSKCKAIGFDKTGTLTTGKLCVERLHPYTLDQKYFASLCASIESASSHPIAVAVSQISNVRYPISNVETVLGSGIEGIVDGKKVAIKKWADLSYKDADVDAEYALGRTVVGVTVDGEIAGYIVLSDTLKESAKEAIDSLKNLGVTTFLVTGDNAKAANTVASSLALDEVYAEQLPHEKLQRIKEKQASSKVAFVGDGANDAPALGTSDVSIALGALNNSVSMDVADICLMEDSLNGIPSTVKLSRKVLRKIHFNIAIAMCINVAAVMLSLFGILTPVLGALVHNCSSVFVCTNSALVLLYDRKK